MTYETLRFYEDWFIKFVWSTPFADENERDNILLKEQHTFNVCKNTKDLAISLNLRNEEINLAVSIALLHDIGRFEQVKRYKTFKDSISINHGFLGADILLKADILEKLPYAEREIILQCVKYHNSFKMPDIEDETLQLYLKLIRDADKIDIWRIFKEHFVDSKKIGNAAVLGLSDIPDYDADLLNFIYEGQIIPLSRVSSKNEFKLMQISWVFDLNFIWSFKVFKDRNYIEILSTLPHKEEISKLKDFINDYINKRIKNG